MASVTSDEIAAYWPLLEFHGRKFGRVSYLAEFDDLVQMGAIAVWQTLERGYNPTNAIIQNAMRDWIKHVTHEGRAHEEASLSF